MTKILKRIGGECRGVGLAPGCRRSINPFSLNCFSKTSNSANQLKPGITTKPPVRSPLQSNARNKSNQLTSNKPNSASTKGSGSPSIRFAEGTKPAQSPPTTATHSPNSLKPFLKTSARSEGLSKSTATELATTAFDPLNPSKTDLPGRVSFSKNDVYEIDYSDFENDTDTSRSLEQSEHNRKKNVRFEDEFFTELSNDDLQNVVESMKASKTDVFEENDEQENAKNDDDGGGKTQETSAPVQRYCCSLKCNSLCKTGDNSISKYESNQIDNSEKIIEEYKREIENINRRHDLELKWSGNTLCETPDPLPDYFGNKRSVPMTKSVENIQSIFEESEKKQFDTPNKVQNYVEIEKRCSSAKPAWNGNTHIASKRPSISSGKTESDDSITKGSSSTVIDNYLKATNQKAPPKGPVAAVAKTKTIKRPLTTASANSNRKIKSAQLSNMRPTMNRMLKAKSVSSLQGSDSKLNEYELDKVESWMSTHEDTFSEAGFGQFRKTKLGNSTGNLTYKRAWRETPTSKTDDEGNFSLEDQIDSNSYDDSTFGDIANVAKQIEQMKVESAQFSEYSRYFWKLPYSPSHSNF